MERVGGENEGRRSSIKQVAFASFIGTAVECYDYFLYGTAAALVFNKLFFPQFAPLTGTLAAFATFAVGFFARPMGGVVFGHFGDRTGRKSMLIITLLVMGGATFLIGLLPTFRAVGVLAVVLLVVLRFLQGLAMGGEWGGATLMAVEHAPDESRNFYASWPQLGAPAGFILSTIVFTAFSWLPEDRFLAWGWRVPFLLSVILVGVGLFIRLRILESPAFRRVKELRAEVRMPLIEVLKRYPIAALLSMGWYWSIWVATTWSRPSPWPTPPGSSECPGTPPCSVSFSPVLPRSWDCTRAPRLPALPPNTASSEDDIPVRR